MLAGEVLRMRGPVSGEPPWEATPEPTFCREPEETEKEEQAEAAKAVTKEEFAGEWAAPGPEFTGAKPEVSDGVRVCRGSRACPAVPD